MSVQQGEQAMAKNKRKMLTRVSSVAQDPCTSTDEVVRKSCAGNHSESSSGSMPTENRSSLMTRFSLQVKKRRKKRNCYEKYALLWH